MWCDVTACTRRPAVTRPFSEKSSRTQVKRICCAENVVASLCKWSIGVVYRCGLNKIRAYNRGSVDRDLARLNVQIVYLLCMYSGMQ